MSEGYALGQPVRSMLVQQTIQTPLIPPRKALYILPRKFLAPIIKAHLQIHTRQKTRDLARNKIPAITTVCRTKDPPVRPMHLVDLAHGRFGEIGLDPKTLHRLAVQLHAQPRRLRYLQMPAFNLEFSQQRMLIDVDAGNGRPTRFLQHRTDMRGKGRRQPRANHLQPEGHLRPSGQIAVA